ncbi:MAG: Carboxylesterase [Candidatus Celerinatantimonas neptuna]|nr:MAG: Carboxylesterase [Candidatus Celerinatantimonas neptuna]
MSLLSFKRWFTWAASLLCIISLCPGCAAQVDNSTNPAPIVNIIQGKIKGVSVADSQVWSFRGIPYAANPFTVENRFKAPKPVAHWSGILDTTVFPDPVPQPSRSKPMAGKPGKLTLNIWTPKGASLSVKKLPVMVWIPGGAFIREDASESAYNGKHFAKQGIIVVTVNYRVGVDGFMHIPGAPDNRGILDQIFALNWVHQNISRFGGNPSDVTLFGQSAGAENVAILLGTPRAKGLFQRAIMQSPPMQTIKPYQAKRLAQAYVAKLGISLTEKDLESVSYLRLVKNVTALGQAVKDRSKWGMLSWGGTAFLPIINTRLIPQKPMDNLARYADSKVPVIVGSTNQESRMFMVPGGKIDKVKSATLKLFLHDLKLPGNASSIYSLKNGQSVGDTYTQLQSDYTFRMTAQHIAETLVKNGNPVWYYHFAWHSPAFNGRLGAAHFVDVPYTFDTIYTTQAKTFVGSSPSESLAKTMHNDWASFAKVGQPNWPQYSFDLRKTMRFDSVSKVVDNPQKEVRRLWSHYRF